MATETTCKCGCGADPGTYAHTNAARGVVAGAPRRYLPGHQVRPGRPRRPVRWAVEDRGYETPCWIWTGTVSAVSGYGDSRDGARTRKAHCVIYEQLAGPIPEGLELDHLCRVRACVNPHHLEPVTRHVNVQRGANAKLTAHDVIEIRQRWAAGGLKQSELAAEFGVTRYTISNIVCGWTWRNIPDPARSAA